MKNLVCLILFSLLFSFSIYSQQLKLELKTDHAEFLIAEPIYVIAILTNISSEAVNIPMPFRLEASNGLTINVIKDKNEIVPYRNLIEILYTKKNKLLNPGESIFLSLPLISVCRNSPDLDDKAIFGDRWNQGYLLSGNYDITLKYKPETIKDEVKSNQLSLNVIETKSSEFLNTYKGLKSLDVIFSNKAKAFGPLDYITKVKNFIDTSEKKPNPYLNVAYEMFLDKLLNKDYPDKINVYMKYALEMLRVFPNNISTYYCLINNILLKTDFFKNEEVKKIITSSKIFPLINVMCLKNFGVNLDSK